MGIDFWILKWYNISIGSRFNLSGRQERERIESAVKCRYSGSSKAVTWGEAVEITRIV
jgi:hypothetical protein